MHIKKRNETRCIICDSDTWIPLFQSCERLYTFLQKKEVFTVLRCQSCGLLTLSPKLRFNELKYYYPKESYYSYSQDIEKGWIFLIRKFLIQKSVSSTMCSTIVRNLFPLPSIPIYRKGDKLLDIGCGSGQTLRVLQQIGWNVYGIDIDKRAIDSAKKGGLTHVTLGSFTSLDQFPDNFFDVIRVYHVIEHLNEPDICLSLIYKKLKPRGQLLIGTPTYDSFIGKMAGTYWFNLDTPRHVYIFNPDNLKLLLEKYDFTIEKIQRASGGGIVASAQYYLSEKYNKNINLLSKHWLLLLFYPLDWFIDRIGLGDIFTMRARK